MWIHVPSAYCPSSAEEEEAILPCASPCLTLELSASSRTTTGRSKSSSRASKTALSKTLLSGTMLSPSTANLGVERWIASLAVSLVWRSVPQASEKALMEKEATSGESTRDLFAKFDQGLFLSKTSQPSLFGESTAYSETWPTSGTMRNGLCSQRKKWELRSSVAASLSSPGTESNWLTPTTEDAGRTGSAESMRKYLEGGQTSGARLRNQIHNWPTPVANDDNKSPEAHLAMKERMGGNRTAITSLNVKVKAWPTPRVSSAHGPSQKEIDEGNPKFRLETEVCLWPTPMASPSGNRTTKRAPSTLEGHGRHLSAEAIERMFPSTPSQASPSATPTVAGNYNRKGVSPTSGDGLSTQATSRSFPQDPTTPTDGETSSPATPTSRPQLNPKFVGWLMGWPQGWVSLKSLGSSNSASSVMESWLHAGQRHLSSLLGAQE